jgi:hypothetical protein
MGRNKWAITAVIVVLMVAGAAVSAVFERRSQHQEQQRVRNAIARWYGHGHTVAVSSCVTLPVPDTEANAANPNARYRCQIVVDGCPQTRSFRVPVESNGTPGDAIGRPLGPPSPRVCF